MATRSSTTVKKKTPAELLREKKINAYLEKISQDEETVSLLSAEKSALFHDNIVGLPVSHRQFGNGQVASQDALTISVQFASGDRRFPIPNAFLDGFLQTEEPATVQRLARHREIDRQITQIKEQIAGANRAIHLLKK